MLRFLLRPFPLAVLVTLLIWFGVIVYWQQTVRQATFEDIGIYLVGLPVAVIVAGFGVRALLRRARRTEPKAEAANPSALPAAAVDESERAFHLVLLALGVAGAAADDAASSYQVLATRELRPAPDGQLRNRDGFPAYACRVQALDTEAVAAALQTIAPTPCAEHVLRALTLLERALAPALDALPAMASKADRQPAAKPAPPAPRLVIDLMLPNAWDDGCRTLAARHVASLIADSGWPMSATDVHVLAAADGTLALQRLDAFALKANRTDSADLYLLAACDSMIDEDIVSTLESSGQLFGSGNGQGRIPGEAAAAVLAAVPRPSPAPVVLVARPALARRAKSADADGRSDCATLLESCRLSLAAAQLQPADIGLVVSDIDQRASRSGECMNVINDLLPELDPVKHFIGAGQALGHLGSAGALYALGIAAAAAEADAKPVLLMAASHASERAATVLRPRAEPAGQPSPAA